MQACVHYEADALFGMTLDFQYSSDVERHQSMQGWSSCLKAMGCDIGACAALVFNIPVTLKGTKQCRDGFLASKPWAVIKEHVALQRLIHCFSEQWIKSSEDNAAHKRDPPSTLKGI